MLKLYTPKEWSHLFDCPRLIIDNDGKIWMADSYYKILSGEPSGKIDYVGGKIYGKDLGYGLFSSPIAYMETKNGVTRIMDAKQGLFSAPILYIENNKVYTPEQWTSIFDCPSGYIKASQVEQAEAEQPEPKQEAATPSADSVLTKTKVVLSYAPADIQAREIADVRAHPYSRYIAEEIAKDWGPGGQMYELLSDPSLMVNRMTLIVSNSNVRFNVECDDSTTKLYETLPQSVWEKDYDFASFTQLPDLNCVGFTVPLTDAQRFGIHGRIRDELAKLPYYSVSLGEGTLTARDLQTKEIHYMSTLFHIVF